MATMFSAGFVRGLVYGSVALTVLGVLTLLVLLVRDYRAGRLW